MWALGSAGTYSRLSLQFGDCPSARPSFGVKVVEEKFLKIYVTPVISEDGWYESLSVYDYEMIYAVYAQVGITPIFIQEVPVACPLLNEVLPNSRSLRSCLRGLSSRTDGRVVYVLPLQLVGSAGFAFSRGGREIAVGLNRTPITLAHELGHTLGLVDLYTDLLIEKPDLGLDLKLEGRPQVERFESWHDWNGGTGFRYYRGDLLHADLIKRSLMYGVKSLGKKDISLFPVQAIRYTSADQTSFNAGFALSGAILMRANSDLCETLE